MGEREGGGTREEVGEREGRGRERVMVSALVIGRRGRGNESGMVENRIDTEGGTGKGREAKVQPCM